MSRITAKFKSIFKSSSVKSGITVLAARGSVIISNFLIFFILVRLCSATDFGTWILFTSIMSIFEVANSSFISNAVIKYYNEFRGSRRPMFVFNGLIFSFILSCLVSVILMLSLYFIRSIYHSGHLITLLYYGPLLLLTSGLINYLNCLEQGNYKFYGQLISSVVKSIVFILYLLMLLVSSSDYSLESMVLANIVGNILALFVILLYSRKYLRMSRRLNYGMMVNIAKYGFFTFGVEVIGQVSNNIGQLISGALLTPASVGVINVASRILQFIEIPLQSISSILMPKGVITMKERGITGIKALYVKSSVLIFVVMFPVLLLFFIFSKEIVYLLAGNNFEEASTLLRIIVVYSLFKPFGRNGGVILNAIGKTKINFLMVLIPTAINLIFNYYLILKFGVIGAPIATLIATVIGFSINQYVLGKEIDLKTADYAQDFRSIYAKIIKTYIKKAQ